MIIRGRTLTAMTLVGLFLVLVGSAWGSDEAEPSGPVELVPDVKWGSGMHPAFLPLGSDGKVLAPPAEGADARKTCGQCHDVGFIEETSSHHAKGVEADCFKCHSTQGAAGWPEEAFDENGMVKRGRSMLVGTDPASCGRCHGIVHTGREPLALPKELAIEPVTDKLGQRFDLTKLTGAIFSGEFVRASHVNVRERGDWLEPWDVHAQRQLTCAACHHSANDLGQAKRQQGALAHLKYDPRRPAVGAYLDRPNHSLVTETCTSCHNPGAEHDFLPQKERHMAAVSCTVCHAPKMNAPTLKSVDETVVTLEGNGVASWRCVDEADKSCLHEKVVHGLVPYVLLEREGDGAAVLDAFNMVTRWQWRSGGEVVPFEKVREAWLVDGKYPGDLLALFDGDGDGTLSEAELWLDSEQKVAAIASRLAMVGVEGAEIVGLVDAHAVSHGIMGGERVVRECSACHSSDSRLTLDVPLSPFVPSGATWVAGEGASKLLGGEVQVVEGGLSWVRSQSVKDLYVLGYSRAGWTDLIGFLLLGMVLSGIAVHGGYRFITRKRRIAAHGPMERVYMYSTYERIWHWLMAISVIFLILTGMEIHTGGEFGVLGFALAVRLHNAFAAVMLINGFLALFFHVASGWIKNFIPDPNSFARRFQMQISYYTRGIFEGAPHPDKKSPENKLNVMQQMTYLALLNVLMPFQVVTGILMGVASWKPEWVEWAGGLGMLSPLHNLGSWLFLVFLILHMYLITTGHTVFSNLMAMIDGHEEVPVEHEGAVRPGGSHE